MAGFIGDDFEVQAQMPCGDWVTIGKVKAEDIVLKPSDDEPEILIRRTYYAESEGYDALWRKWHGFPAELT